MVNAVYPKYKEAILSGSANSALSGSGATGLYAALVDTGAYAYSSAHEFYGSVSGVVADNVEVGNVTLTNGLIDGDNLTWLSATGNQSEAIVLYRKNAGANTTWRLVAYIDTGVTNLPVTPNGGDISIVWPAAGIVRL